MKRFLVVATILLVSLPLTIAVWAQVANVRSTWVSGELVFEDATTATDIMVIKDSMDGVNIKLPLDCDSTLNVDGASTLVGAVAVTGALTQTGAIDLNSYLDLDAASDTIYGANILNASNGGGLYVRSNGTGNVFVASDGATAVLSIADGGAITSTGNITLDDGATHSPTVVLTDAGDAAFTFQKQNDGFLTGTPTEATKGLNILTGNLKVGNGTPGVTQDGEDVYIEGTLEVDAASTFDGAVDFNSTITFGTRSWNVTQYSADPNAAAWLATVSGLDADDYVIATLNTAPGNGAYLLSAVASVGGATITLNADPNESVKITIISLQD